jgi:putative aminopeptidase FrvX
MNVLEVLQNLVRAPGPPGQEDQVRDLLAEHLTQASVPYSTDPKGNLIVRLGEGKHTPILVTAHLDEIALCVQQVCSDGTLVVRPLGGIHPWKLGEGPVLVMAGDESFEAVLGFGSIHTESEASSVQQAKTEEPQWEMARVLTGLSESKLIKRGVRPGTRVVVSPSRRELTLMGDLVAGYFLDDRADLVSWLLAIIALQNDNLDVTFVATTSEEVGGEGAQYFLERNPCDVCIALELGPNVPDAHVEINAHPTVWAIDSYAATPPHLLEIIHDLCPTVQFQALTRGGSDASCAAARGLCAHPITLGIPMENSHGYEIIHRDSMAALADLTVALVRKLQASG